MFEAQFVFYDEEGKETRRVIVPASKTKEGISVVAPEAEPHEKTFRMNTIALWESEADYVRGQKAMLISHGLERKGEEAQRLVEEKQR
jgi:hypothetical protein